MARPSSAGRGRSAAPPLLRFLGALAVAAAVQSATAAPSYRPPAGVRLEEIQSVSEARLTLEPEIRRLEELGLKIRVTISESLNMAPSQRKLTTLVAGQDCRSIDLLRAIEHATRMRWWELDAGQWQLARDQVEAASLYLAAPGRPAPDTVDDYARAASQRSREFVRSLTRDQWSRLAGGLVLQFNELRPDQQRLLLGSLDASVFGGYGPSGPTREARQGRVAIYMTDQLDPSRNLGLAFAYPSRMMPGYQPLGKTREELDWATGVYIQPNADGTYGPSNPDRRLYPPGRTPRRPADPSPEEDRKDPRLQRVLDLGEDPPAWEKLVGAMQKATELAVFLEGDYLKKPAPFAVRKLSVLEVMDRLAEHTGRRWERIGELRVLAPIPDEEKKPPSGATRAGRTSTPSR